MIDWERFYNAFRKPDFIPGYEIQNHLGGGAFGEVYRARKSSIGKAYAIKFLRLDDPGGKDAGERELEQVRLFAAIDHPHLVTIEDMGVVMGVPYLIMGYAGEDTLARRLARRELDRDTALRTFVQVARGVLALHDRRLAHFDLKPSNVFLNGDVARVGDYGLAKLLKEGRQTLSFGRGTPHYMAPEMLRSRADHRADIYSLGVILFECLTFELPFGKEEGGALVVREDDEPPRFPPDFPVALRPVVERCLRLDPAQRHGSVHELLEAMGQTARQGDSVRVAWEQASAGPDPVPPGPEDAAASSSGSWPAREELRTAAAELARGALGVARGVWDGVVERVSGGEQDGKDGASDESAPPGRPGEEDVVVVHTLEEPDEPSTDVLGPRLSTPDSPWRQELRRQREAREGRESRTLHATVPVPPRAEGGWRGSVVQSLLLGTEILTVLVTGPVWMVARGSALAVDRTLKGVPWLLGRGLRLGLYLLLLAGLGGLCALVVLAALAVNA
jgi:hypothetical protein